MSTNPLSSGSTGDVYILGGNFSTFDGSPNHSPPNGIPLSAVAVGALHDSTHRYPPPKCHPGTRDAVLGILETWMANRSASTKPILWLHGTAGVGKSAILQTTCESSMGDGGPIRAAFFFGRGQGQRALSRYLIPTLAYQISQSDPNYRSRLRSILETNGDIFDKAMPAQLKTLLVKPLVADNWLDWFRVLLGWTKPPITLVIDGLDECEGEENQALIVDTLLEATRAATTRPIRFLVASRPEAHILHAFDQEVVSGQTKRVPLDDSFKPAEAIRLFLIDQFRLIVDTRAATLSHVSLSPSWPGSDIIAILVVAAEGQFIYAHLVIAFVKMPHTDPLQQLQIVLDAARNHVAFSPLDNLYLHILCHVAPHLQAALRQTLICLVVLAEPQTVDVIADIVAIDETTVRLVLEQLRAVLRADSKTGALFDHPIAFAHTSFRDFLINPNRADTYTVNVVDSHNIILAMISHLLPVDSEGYLRATPRVRYVLDPDHLAYHARHLRLSSAPRAHLEGITMSTEVFHCNLVTLFTRLGHPAIDAIYLHILSNVSPRLHEVLMKTLLCLVALAEPQPVNVLADILSLGDQDIESVIEELRTVLLLVDLNTDDIEHTKPTVSFAHMSFRKFLIDPARSGSYTIDIDAAHYTILDYLSNPLPPSTLEEPPKLLYARNHLSHHITSISLSVVPPSLKLNLPTFHSNLNSLFKRTAHQGFDIVYFHTLRNIPSSTHSVLMKTLTCLIAVVKKQRSLDVIADILSLDEEVVELVFERLRPVLRGVVADGKVDLHQPIALIPSFRDFLLDPKRAGTYAVNSGVAAQNFILAQLSLPFPSDSPPSSLKLQYARTHLSHHLIYLSLTSTPPLVELDLPTFRSNLATLFRRVEHGQDFNVLYRHIIRTNDFPYTGGLALACLLAFAEPQPLGFLVDVLSMAAFDLFGSRDGVMQALTPFRSVIHNIVLDDAGSSAKLVTFADPSFQDFLINEHWAGGDFSLSAHYAILTYLSEPPSTTTSPNTLKLRYARRHLSHHIINCSLSDPNRYWSAVSDLDLTTFLSNLMSLSLRVGHPGFDELYHHTLGAIPPQHQTTLGQVLSFLVHNKSATIDQLTIALSTESVDISIVLDGLKAIVCMEDTLSEDGVRASQYSFAHSSLRGFLLDPARSGVYAVKLGKPGGRKSKRVTAESKHNYSE